MEHNLTKMLDVPKENLKRLDDIMQSHNFSPCLTKVEKENSDMVNDISNNLGAGEKPSFEELRKIVLSRIEKNEKELMNYIGVSEDDLDFSRIAKAARDIATETKGFFLKKDYAKEILLKRPPENTMKSLGYSDVEEMLKNEDVGDVFSALRFGETDEWMHETFEVAYKSFTPDDFEERDVEIRVLGEQYREVAEKFVAKKHHNVSHLKEFGVIFLNPIAQKGTGKFIRDFALLLHYFHEIAFYSKLFRKYSDSNNFNDKFISLLRGDVPEAEDSDENNWLIVQRYLWKDDPQDKRLFVPRVNPEAIHWQKAQQDLVALGKKNSDITIDVWDNSSWVAGLFSEKIFSFEMEDNAMALADYHDGKDSYYNYHQREAMWNKIFSEYVGGYEKMEDMIIDNMGNGMIRLEDIFNQ